MTTIKVFLADDHAVVRDGLRALLERERDIRVVGDAGNGRDAVQRAVETRPDVVIVDITMPGLNGIEVAQRVREGCPGAEVVILSMHSTSEHIHRALAAGARGYVVKASAGSEVVDAVRAVHAGRLYLSRKISDEVVRGYVGGRAADAEGPLASLSRREREVLQLVAEGKSSAEVAAIVCLSVKTVETYRSRLMQKLGVDNLPALVRFAIEYGLTPLS